MVSFHRIYCGGVFPEKLNHNDWCIEKNNVVECTKIRIPPESANVRLKKLLT